MLLPRAALLLLPVLLLPACGNRSFSASEWKSLREAGDTGSRMVSQAKALVRGGEALGLSPTEVIQLLGEDDDATGRGPPGELEWVIDEGIMGCTVLRLDFGPDRKACEVFTYDISY